MTMYGYKQKKTTFGSQGPTIGKAYQPVSYGGGVSSGGTPAAGRELPSGLFGQGSRAQERGIPERIPPASANPMGLVDTAVRAPGHVLERPLGIINVLTGGAGENKGAVDHLFDAIGQVGIGSSATERMTQSLNPGGGEPSRDEP